MRTPAGRSADSGVDVWGPAGQSAEPGAGAWAPAGRSADSGVDAWAPAGRSDAPEGGPAPTAPGWQTGPAEDWNTGSQPAVVIDPRPASASQPGQQPYPPATSAQAQPPYQAATSAQAQPPYQAQSAYQDQPAYQSQAAHQSGEAGAADEPVNDGDEAWAMLGYLGVPFVSVLAPLTVYLLRARGSAYVRRHVTQALNLSITLLLYNICVLILGVMLSLDTVSVALTIAVPAALVLWLATLAYLVRATIRASLGGYFQLPRWICATIVR